ncbi:MAG TPA: 2-phospho-L-lactate guanylyltransferase [Chloroflexota bacterium]|nr:2-phospho-L-lactate guanylyltransferase [Chloroflexota bacterium]
MIAAVIPLKDPERAKSRLAGVLRADDRIALVLQLAERTVEVVRDSGVADRIALAVTDRQLADCFGVEWVPDEGSLNATLRAAVGWAKDADGLLVVAADLPLLSSNDLRTFAGALPGCGVTIAVTPDGGTGALLLRPPRIITPQFGANSAERHATAASRAGVPVWLIHRGGLTRDLDTGADLETLGRYLPVSNHAGR